MLLDLPAETVQTITQTAQHQGVTVAELLNQTFYQQPKTPLAERIHQRFQNLYDDNNEFDFETYLPQRNQYPKGLDL